MAGVSSNSGISVSAGVSVPLVTGSSSSAAVISPDDIFGLALWLDASDTTTITDAGSGAVSAWADKSGFSRNFTQGTGANRPTTGLNTINGKNVLKFDGTNDFLTAPASIYGFSNAANTIIAVVRPNVKQIANIIAGADGGTSRWRLLASDASNAYVGGSNSTTGVVAGATVPAPIAGELATITSVFQTTSSTVTAGKSGALGAPAAGDVFTMTTARIGSATSGVQFLNADLAELIIYSRALNNSELNQIGAYLRDKWGSPWTDIQTPPAPLQGKSTLVAFGDSVTLGTGASSVSYSYIGIVTAAMRTISTNKGIGGTVLQNSSSLANNGRDRYVADLTGAAKRDVVIICYGYNDMRYTVGDPMNLANYQNDLQEVLTGLLGAGYATTDIVLCSLPWATDALYSSGGAGFTGSNRTIHESYVAAIKAIAVTNAVLYAPIYETMLAVGTAAIIDADNIHPNDAGHALAAMAVLNATIVH
jgi:lysophospholipase L1-like esterase